MREWDKLQWTWAAVSIATFLHFVTLWDPAFKGWGDVFYFCGARLQYCTCKMHWNLLGWGKGAILWNFVLATALGLQKLVIQTGLDGLLPGEEVVTKESFVSILWRLIPYWLNNWEQQWGAECSSMLFELPHYALELLVVLPLVQIICSRLRILALAPGRHLVHADAADEQDTENLAPDILTGTWHVDPAQRRLLPRLRANWRVMLFMVAMASIAAFNALTFSLAMEQTVLSHVRTPPAIVQQCPAFKVLVNPFSPHVHSAGAGYLASRFSSRKNSAKLAARLGGFADAFAAHAAPNVTQAFEDKRCAAMNYNPDKGWAHHLVSLLHTQHASVQPAEIFQRKMDKHVRELAKICSTGRSEAIAMVEVLLAIMRLCCEKFFVLATVFAAYLLYRDDVPFYARIIARTNHHLSSFYQKTILYCFPAICWIYGAGWMFSGFASLIFWAAPVQQIVHWTRTNATVIRPVGLKDATEEEVERMNGSCAVCWGDMGAPLPRAAMQMLGAGGGARPPAPVEALAPGKALPCGHAFHTACIRRWLAQCHRQSREPTCPMCNATIQLEVTWRIPNVFRARKRRQARAHAPAPVQGQQPPVGNQWRNADLPAMLNDAEVLIPPNEAGWELADGAQEAEQDAAALQQAGADADNVVFSDEDDLSSQSEHSSAEDDSSPGGFTSITDAIEASMSAQAESSDGAYAESNAQSRVGMAQDAADEHKIELLSRNPFTSIHNRRRLHVRRRPGETETPDQ